MNLKQITAFSELMLTGSVSEAARNLNRTQPSVSHQISSLEASLGMALFERRKGRLHPVPEAQYLFQECTDLLQRLGSISQNMRRMKAMERGDLMIASMPGPSVFLLPDFISKQLGDKTEVRTTLLSRSSDAVHQLVGSQQYDIGIADHDPSTTIQTALVSARIFSFDCLCAVPSGDALANEPVISPADLDQRPMALLFREHISHQRIARAFASTGSSLNTRFITQYFIPLLTYVERGLACSIVDPLTIEAYRLYRGESGGIAFRRFAVPIEFSVAMLTPKYRPASLVAAAFADRLGQEFCRLGARVTEADDAVEGRTGAGSA